MPHAVEDKGTVPLCRSVCRGSAWRRWRRPSSSDCHWTRAGRSSASRTRRSSAPTGRRRTSSSWSRSRASSSPSRSSRSCCARGPRCSPPRCTSTTLILRVTLNTGRGGTHQLDRALFVGPKGEGKNEYLPSLAAFDYGPRFVLDRFAELVPCLPVHSAGHPPGLLLVMHYLGLDTSPRLTAFILFVGAAQRAADLRPGQAPVRRGRRARSPACWPRSRPRCCTSARPAPTPSTSRSACSPRSRCSRGRLWLGAIALAVVWLFAWSLLAVAAWAAILVWARDGFKAAFRLGADHRRGPARLPRRCSRWPPASTRSAR